MQFYRQINIKPLYFGAVHAHNPLYRFFERKDSPFREKFLFFILGYRKILQIKLKMKHRWLLRIIYC